MDDFTCDSGGNNVRDGRYGYGEIPGNEFQVRPSPLSLLREFAPEFGPFWGNPEILPSHCAEWIRGKAQRTNEVCFQMAFGVQCRHLLRIVFASTLGRVVTGSAIGLALHVGP